MLLCCLLTPSTWLATVTSSRDVRYAILVPLLSPNMGNLVRKTCKVPCWEDTANSCPSSVQHIWSRPEKYMYAECSLNMHTSERTNVFFLFFLTHIQCIIMCLENYFIPLVSSSSVTIAYISFRSVRSCILILTERYNSVILQHRQKIWCSKRVVDETVMIGWESSGVCIWEL